MKGRLLVKLALGLVLMMSIAYFVLFRLGAGYPPEPSLSADVQSTSMRVDGMERTFTYFVPRTLGPSPGLVLAFHGGGGSAAQMRGQTAYELDRIAEAEGVIVVYPEAHEGHWNTCQRARTAAATELGVDDLAFARALVSWFEERHGIDRTKVFAVGFSNGGHMVYRLVLEAPELLRAAAVVAANLPTPADSKCELHEQAMPLLVINGVDDPINPYEGGELSFHGLWDMGPVMGTEQTARTFAGEATLDARERVADGDGDPTTWIERITWADSRVTALAVHGGGHGIPQRGYRFPLAFGSTSTEMDACDEIWAFFERQLVAPPNDSMTGSAAN